MYISNIMKTVNKWILLICMFTCVFLISCSDEENNDPMAIAVSTFTPSGGLVGTEVTITGTGFTKETSVWFNETKATDIVSVENTSIVVRVPVGATTGRIGVINGEESAFSTGSFTFIPGAAVTGYIPGSALPGEVVIIAGTDFHEVGAENIKVVFAGDVIAQPTAATATNITVVVPEGAVTGPVSVIFDDMETVVGPSFEVLVPSIKSYTSTMAAVGAELGINVMNFPAVEASDIHVSFAGENETIIPATVKSFATGVITVEVPEGAVTGVITITLDGFEPIVGDEFMITPVVTGYSPTSAKVGETIFVQGTNFPISGEVTVLFKAAEGGESETVSSVGTFTAEGLSVEVPSGAVTGVVSLVIGENTVPGKVFTVIESFTYSFLCKDVAENGGDYAISSGVNPCDNAKEDGTGTVIGEWKKGYRGGDASAKGMIVWDTKKDDYIIFEVEALQEGDYKIAFDAKLATAEKDCIVGVTVNADLSKLLDVESENGEVPVVIEKSGLTDVAKSPYNNYETETAFHLSTGKWYVRILYKEDAVGNKNSRVTPLLRKVRIFN